MFQYAAGRALALYLGVPIFIDRRSFEKDYKLRSYGLDCFRIPADDAPVELLPITARQGLIGRMLRRWMPRVGTHVYREKSFSYDDGFERISANTYIEGYWQSERYFLNASEQIRRDFVLSELPSSENQMWLNRINNALSVSVHVRRGDYITNPAANKTHGTCSLDYYSNAISELCQRLSGRPEFFIFSDAPEWVRENLSFGEYQHHFIAHNDALNCHEDLRLMASCKHHIIANSTFSWWGAWLNPSVEKMVIAPKQWFRDESLSTKDLIPAGWFRV